MALHPWIPSRLEDDEAPVWHPLPLGAAQGATTEDGGITVRRLKFEAVSIVRAKGKGLPPGMDIEVYATLTREAPAGPTDKHRSGSYIGAAQSQALTDRSVAPRIMAQ